MPLAGGKGANQAAAAAKLAYPTTFVGQVRSPSRGRPRASALSRSNLSPPRRMRPAASRLRPSGLPGPQQVGADGNGALLKGALAACGVDLALVSEVPEPTGQAIILLQPSGENSIVILGGANASWAAPTLAALDKVRSAAFHSPGPALFAHRLAFASGGPSAAPPRPPRPRRRPRR